MQMRVLKSFQQLLLLNWVVAPALAAWFWYFQGFKIAIVFVVSWIILDWLWDWVATVLLKASTSKLTADAEQQYLSGRSVPGRAAATMMTDLLGTLAVPWLVAVLLMLWR